MQYETYGVSAAGTEKTKLIGFKVSETDKARIRKTALQRGVSASELMRRIVLAEIQRWESMTYESV